MERESTLPNSFYEANMAKAKDITEKKNCSLISLINIEAKNLSETTSQQNPKIRPFTWTKWDLLLAYRNGLKYSN